MPNEIYTGNFSGNYPLVLARKMQLLAIQNMFWGRWAAGTTKNMAPVNPGNEPRASNSPIVVHNELRKKAGNLIEVPIHRSLSMLPRTGNEMMEGHEEEAKINFAQVPVELMRAAEKPEETSAQGQLVKDMRLLKMAEPALQQHYTRVLTYLTCTYAFYYGYNYNVLKSPRWAGDSKIAANSHPHIFFGGSGKVSYSGGYPGTSGYETSVATEITNLGSSDVFDTDFLSGVKASQDVLKIPPLRMKDGNALRFIAAHPWQIATLENDSNFVTAVSRADAQAYAKDNPLLYACKYVWGGFAIFPTDTGVFPLRVASGVPQYGPAAVQHTATPTGDLDSFENYSADTKFGAILFGPSALLLATADKMEFRYREADYGEFHGVEWRQILGAARADFWNRDDGTTGQYLQNRSSAILATYASAPSF